MNMILHITPHLGGGVGRVLRNYLTYTRAHEGDRHLLACLDYANAVSTAWAEEMGVTLKDRLALRLPELQALVAQVDLVVLHWWNHPLLYDLLVRHPLPPARVLLWSHVNGHCPPQIFSQALVAYPDLFVVATPYSFESAVIRPLSSEQRESQLRLIFSCAGIDHVTQARPRAHTGFRIGYIGTVDYVKMHRDFLQMSAAARIPGVRLVVCGGPQEEAIRREAQAAGIAEKFDFRGHVADVAQVLSELDVFGYPLAPGHYGTGEQSLIEALAAGVPTVVLDNGPEGHVVEHGETGIVAADPKAYTAALESLYQNPDLRLALAAQARSRARQRFPIDTTARAWRDLYLEALELPKRARVWPGINPGPDVSPAQVFIHAMGEHGALFSQSLYSPEPAVAWAAEDAIAKMQGLVRAQTRGSVFHYRSFFPDDPHLNLWAGLMLLGDGNLKEATNSFAAARSFLPQWRLARYPTELRASSGYAAQGDLPDAFPSCAQGTPNGTVSAEG